MNAEKQKAAALPQVSRPVDRRKQVKTNPAFATLQASLRERLARTIYPEGFYFDRDTSLLIDRLTARLESLGVRV